MFILWKREDHVVNNLVHSEVSVSSVVVGTGKGHGFTHEKSESCENKQLKNGRLVYSYAAVRKGVTPVLEYLAINMAIFT